VRRALALLLCLTLLPGCSLVRRRAHFYSVRSASMEPSIHAGDRIGCATKVPNPLRRGMVVTFRPGGYWTTSSADPTFVKRVVGLPGEVVAGDDHGVVTIDGTPLAEPYLPPGGRGSRAFAPVTVPAGSYFLMGDNRDRSADSRDSGPIGHATVTAVCTNIVAPKSHRGRIPGT
jgi:signal peptidase I